MGAQVKLRCTGLAVVACALFSTNAEADPTKQWELAYSNTLAWVKTGEGFAFGIQCLIEKGTKSPRYFIMIPGRGDRCALAGNGGSSVVLMSTRPGNRPTRYDFSCDFHKPTNALYYHIASDLESSRYDIRQYDSVAGILEKSHPKQLWIEIPELRVQFSVPLANYAIKKEVDKSCRMSEEEFKKVLR